MLTGESTYKCVTCVKSQRSLRSDDTPVKTRTAVPATTEDSSPVKVISPDRALELPPIFEGDKYEAQLVQLETIRLNGQCAVDLLKSLLDLVHKLNEDVMHLKNDNTSLKLQLNELKESVGPQPRIIAHATGRSLASQPILKNAPKKHQVASTAISSPISASSVPAAGTSADDKVLSYKDVASAGLPSANAVPVDSDGFVLVTRKKKPTADPAYRGKIAASSPPAETAAISRIKPRRQPLIGVRNSATLPVVKREKMKALFVSRFSPEVAADDIRKSLEEQLSLKKLACTRLKTKFNSYASFHVSVTEDEFSLINDVSVWPSGVIIAPYYGKLEPNQVYTPVAPEAGVSAAPIVTVDNSAVNVTADEGCLARAEGTETYE
jgi:hypothetical protein